MKLKQRPKKVRVLPDQKPKRLDLNSNHRRVLEKVESLSPEMVAEMVAEIEEWGGSLTPSFSQDQPFYDPSYIASFLGLSLPTVERYTDGFVRIIRREGESAKDFKARKRTFHSPETPLLSRILAQNTSPRSYRLISARVLIFVCLSTTSVRSADKRLRDLQHSLQSMSGITPAKARKIGPLEAVRKWDV